MSEYTDTLCNLAIDTCKRIYVIDLETGVHNQGADAIGKNKSGSPFHPDNKIIMYGSTEAYGNLDLNSNIYNTDTNFEDNFKAVLLDADVLVGHNIKFDILYLLKYHNKEIMDFLHRGGSIWDTQQAEYLLTGQEEMFMPLGNKYNNKGEVVREGLACKYGGTDKLDKVKDFWDSGYMTEDIPEGMLSRYLIGDLKNTEMAFYSQLDNTLDKSSEFSYLMATQMDSILATTIMEYNGMYFNIETAQPLAESVEKTVNKEYDYLNGVMYDHFSFSLNGAFIDRNEVSPAKLAQLNAYLFGGGLSYKARVDKVNPDGTPQVYKTGLKKGQVKSSMQSIILTSKEPYTFKPEVKARLTKTQKGYTLDEAGLTILMDELQSCSSLTGMHLKEFIESLLRYRQASKDLNTYYISLLNLTWPTDSCIHGSLNHNSTGTGRLSSSAPNMQNISG